MDIKNTRRENLRALIEQEKKPHKQSALARRLGWSASYLNQLVGPARKRGIGHQAARHIERTLGLPQGWMDQSHAAPLLTEDLLLEAIRAVEKALHSEGAEPTPEQRARLYVLVYKRLQLGPFGVDDIKELVGLVA